MPTLAFSTAPRLLNLIFKNPLQHRHLRHHLNLNIKISTTVTNCIKKRKMAINNNNNNDDEGGRTRDPSTNPKVSELRQLITHHPSASSSSSDGWEKCWEEGVTPWDLGQPTPVVLHLLQTGALRKGRALVPGCGTGYDVVAMASPDHRVLGLDISSSAIEKAKQWSSSLPNANYFDFLAADFFTWQPTELFDLVFDYTFFCAIKPPMRSSWARKMGDILKPDGELVTLIYLINDQACGPPFNNSVADYEEVLNPIGFTAISIVDNELAIKPRREAAYELRHLLFNTLKAGFRRHQDSEGKSLEGGNDV